MYNLITSDPANRMKVGKGEAAQPRARPPQLFTTCVTRYCLVTDKSAYLESTTYRLLPLEARAGIEPAIEALQTLALPLGYRATPYP